MARARQAAIDPTSPLMTVGECASTLGVSEETVTALVETWRWLGSQKVGRKYIIPRAAFHRLYVEGMVEPEPIRTTEPTGIAFLRRVS